MAPQQNGNLAPPDENTSLLRKSSNSTQAPEQGASLNDVVKSWNLVYYEFLIILRGSIPVILAYTLQMSLQTLSIVIVGRGSADDLATAAFSYMFAMATAWLIALGGSTALDTLGSSSFTGSKNPYDLGILLQRAFIVLALLYVPIAILWAFSEPVFLALGQDPQISRDSARFLRCLIPGGLGYIYFESMKKYLQAQGKLLDLCTLSIAEWKQRSCDQAHMSCLSPHRSTLDSIFYLSTPLSLACLVLQLPLGYPTGSRSCYSWLTRDSLRDGSAGEAGANNVSTTSGCLQDWLCSASSMSAQSGGRLRLLLWSQVGLESYLCKPRASS